MFLVGLLVVVASMAAVLHGIDISNSHLVTIDTGTSAITDVGALGVTDGSGALAYNTKTGTMFWVSGQTDSNLYTINLATGAATVIGSHGLGNVFALGYDHNNVLYAAPSSGGLYSLSQATGAATFIASQPKDLYGGMTFDTSRHEMVILGLDPSFGMFSLDLGTGATTLLGTPTSVNDGGIAYVPGDDKFFIADENGKLLSVDPESSYASTTLTSTGTFISALAFVPLKVCGSASLAFAVSTGALCGTATRFSFVDANAYVLITGWSIIGSAPPLTPSYVNKFVGVFSFKIVNQRVKLSCFPTLDYPCSVSGIIFGRGMSGFADFEVGDRKRDDVSLFDDNRVVSGQLLEPTPFE